MPHPKNVMEVFQTLDKSNCMKCGEKTCLAFAGAVFRNQKKISECPKIDQKTTGRFSEESEKLSENSLYLSGAEGEQVNGEQNRDQYMDGLINKIANLDFIETAERTGGRLSGDKLTLHVLGRAFSVDKSGHLFTDIHINPWIAVPFLKYVLYGKGLPVSGEWVSFRELKNEKERYPLFQKRCELAMKRIADIYTEFFNDIVSIFSGKKVEKQFQSDISIVLYPLPKLPVMICYWMPEDGMESTLNVFFDKTADQNLDTGAVFSLGSGLAQMFEKMAARHGFSGQDSFQ